MIKLIASDIDGTLVVEGTNKINPELFEVIIKLKEKGIYFAAASGRSVSSIESLFAPIRERIFYLADNGAYVGSYGRVLFSSPIDPLVVRDLIMESRRIPACELMIATTERGYTETKNQKFLDWIDTGYQMKLKRMDDLTELTDDVIKVSFHIPQRIERMLTDPMPKYKGKIKYTISGDTWLDCVAPDVNKGAAIKILQDSLEITKHETMAFGDRQNDIEMMRQAHYSYAVGNAVDEVKEAARFITDTNENDGVLKILKTLI